MEQRTWSDMASLASTSASSAFLFPTRCVSASHITQNVSAYFVPAYLLHNWLPQPLASIHDEPRACIMIGTWVTSSDNPG